MQLQRLREYIRKLELRRYLVQAHVAVLDRLMCEEKIQGLSPDKETLCFMLCHQMVTGCLTLCHNHVYYGT